MHYYDKGDIKYIPPQIKGQQRSNRVDGLSLTALSHNDSLTALSHSDSLTALSHTQQEQGESAYATRDFHGRSTSTKQPTMNFNKLDTEVLCWNCLGWGHTKQRCPSSNIPRSIADAHRIFGQRLARDAQQYLEQATQARRRPLGRGSQRRPPMAMTTTEIHEDDNDWEDDDEDDQEEESTATSFLT